MASADEEGGREAPARVHLSGVQDERETRHALDNGSLDQLRHRHAVTNRQAGRALDTAGRRHALPVVAITCARPARRLFYRPRSPFFLVLPRDKCVPLLS